ncbi:2Fe-2S iron-sulfur cluster binding domain-containing protein [Azospirillum sp. RWY-5-1]|uniref:2Fe-2S iron-sulfur cluster binding domain-containing protein n=1 Tax=Azospirillum oleiclasticum TaxID=2735135 RepID=A0ABX2TCQ8_9PROT|nr:2Fe-2S iron-sulfur cluster binding domain-containing protein [Azospirillum oleiclasticum]NYZ15825.1 2Fe-2S iron-sulfur cluster binding domain-containing protein [Azospirillum oleiclasticum]NYZ22095.1 2Fe-2S iron-sulfur cluster binding domain-containing protein [Azospirillum oleiclasticum]
MDSSRITIANTGIQFSCARHETILDAALRQGVTLPHNCRGGACGRCKADVVAGQVEHGWVMSFAITDEEKEAGQCLVCVSKPGSPEVVVSMHNHAAAEERPPIVPVTTQATVVASTPVTAQVREIVLALDPGCGFRFRAGMHVELGEEAGDLGRPYSIATAPDGSGAAPLGLIVVHVALQPGGVTSAWLHGHARVGTRLTMRGPYGDFGFADAAAEGLVLLAGGTGLAPLLSIAGEALRGGYAAPVELGLSVRTAADVFGVRELEALARAHDNFHYWVTLTRHQGPARPEPWRTGRIPDLLSAHAADLRGRQFLIAGPPGFVGACEAALAAIGVPAGRIAAESYTARLAPLRAAG